MPRRTKLTNDHKDKISLSMKAYHSRVKACLAKEIARNTKPPKPKPSRRVTPVLVAPFVRHRAVRHRAVALNRPMSKGQQTTAKRLSRLEQRVKRGSGTDTAPWLGF